MMKKETKISDINELLIFFLIYSGYLKVLFYKYETFVFYIQYGVLGITLIYSLIKIFRIKIWKFTNVHLFFLLFAYSFFLSKIYSNSVVYSQIKFQNMFLTVIYCICLYICVYDCDIDRILRFIVNANILIIIIYATINYRDIINAFSTSFRFGNDAGDNPIWVGRFCLDTFFIMLYTNLCRKEHLRVWHIIEYLLLLLLIFLTGSKANWLALIIGSAVLSLLFSSNHGKKIKFIKYLFFLCIAVIVLFVAFRTQITNFIYSRFSFSLIDAPGYRVHTYRYALRHFSDRLWMGHGLGSWATYYSLKDVTSYPHNIVLESLFECGILNTIFLLGFIIATIKKGVRLKGTGRAILILFISNLIYAMFSGSLSEGNRGIYLFAMIVAACYSSRKENKKYYTIMYNSPYQ